MINKFEIVNFLDNCRWESTIKNNYGLINYSKTNLSNNLKLLTHWISYITDRQMKFEIIWDVGGFVFSDMLYNYKVSNNGMDVLNPNYSKSNFIKKQNGQLTFISNTLVCESPTQNGKLLLNKYGFKDEDRIEFVSRFFPADYVSIFYTLHTLETFNKDFFDFIIKVLNNVAEQSPQNLVKTLAYSLYLLTYDNIGQPTAKSINYEKLLKIAENRTTTIHTIIDNSTLLKQNVEKFYKNGQQYKIKRIWCCIRDYLKSDEFCTKCFKAELLKRNVNKKIINNLFSEDAKKTVELPGDVWNNNSIFRNCLLKDVDLSPKEQQENLRNPIYI